MNQTFAINNTEDITRRSYHEVSHDEFIRNLHPIGAGCMMTPQAVLGCDKGEPFRPFRIHPANGRTFDIRHPEMTKALKSNALVFKSNGEGLEMPDEWESASLMITESNSHLEAQSVT